MFAISVACYRLAMEDSFRVRVDKAFGSLAAFQSSNASSSSSSSSLSSLWCLTDEEIERREWNRSKDSADDGLESKRYPSNLDGFFANQRMGTSTSRALSKPSDFHKQLESDLQELNDYEDDDDLETREKERCGSLSRQLVNPDDHDDEEWDVRSSIGVDCTLDYEEEEDEYDKVAVDREKASDCLYMRDITEYGIDINTYHELPNSFRDATRDPRANHIAAKIRLKEDAETAAKFGSLNVSDANRPPSLIPQSSRLEDGTNLKPILKKREKQMDSKLQKRVRFEYESYTDGAKCSDTAKDSMMETCHMEVATTSNDALYKQSHDSTDVPDYIRNPSRYKHYTFDSTSDIDELSNRKAYEDFLNLLKTRNTSEARPAGMSIDLSKSVAFTPMKKTGDVSNARNMFKQSQEDVCQESAQRNGLPIGIAAGDAQESEACAMEEDEPAGNLEKGRTFQKQGRRYRMKPTVDLDEHVR